MSNGTEPTIPSAAAPSEPKIWGYFATSGRIPD
jgi:hypothetical protein